MEPNQTNRNFVNPPLPSPIPPRPAANNSLMQTVWRQTGIAAKLAAIALVTLILWIPACVVEHLIDERASRQEEVVREIASKWGGRQLITGPILYEKGTSTLPDTLDVTGEISPEIRHRGIFQTVIYTAKLTFSGTFAKPAGAETLDCVLAMSDIKGVHSAEIKIDGKKYPLQPMDCRNLAGPFIPDNSYPPDCRRIVRTDGGKTESSMTSANLLSQIGVSFRPAGETPEKISYEITLSLQGTESLLIDPVGRLNKIVLKSNWASPGFTGVNLPAVRKVEADGFTAEWELSDLNTGYRRQWTSNDFEPGKMASGVELMIPVNTYQQTTRATRYAVLFIGIFLFTMLLAEVLTKLHVCMIQYILAGCAPVVFYLLLLSLGEQTGFAAGYLIASTATVALTAFYCTLIFRKKLAVLGVTAMLAASYGIMYLILRMEDIALLAGSFAVFIILAVLMGITGGLNGDDSGPTQP